MVAFKQLLWCWWFYAVHWMSASKHCNAFLIVLYSLLFIHHVHRQHWESRV